MRRAKLPLTAICLILLLALSYNTSLANPKIQNPDLSLVACDIVITAQEIINLNCTDNTDPASCGQATFTATGPDCGNLNLRYTDNIIPGNCPESYTIERLWEVIDDAGAVQASKLQIINITDTQAPQFNETLPPYLLIVQCDAIPDPDILTANDNCAGPVEVLYTETMIKTPPVDCDYNYSVSRLWSASDNCGNTVEYEQMLVVMDNTPPVFDQIIEPEITVECDAIPEGVLLTATDNCDDFVDVTLSEFTTPGQCDNQYTIIRTWTAIDDCNNITELSQTINVVDQTSPICNIPANTSVILCQSEPICMPVGCIDNCDPNPSISLVNGPGQIINGEWCYTPTTDEFVSVTVRCEDACGNFCEATFTVDIIFNSPPLLECPDAKSEFFCKLGTQPYCLPGFVINDADDNIVDINVIGGTLLGESVCFDPVEGLNTIIVTVTDACGESVSCTTSVDIEVNDPPSIVCPNPATIHWGTTYVTILSASDPNTNDNITFSLGNDAPDGMTIDPQTGKVIWTTDKYDLCTHTVDAIITDDCGASDTCSFEICVQNTPPQISCPDTTYTTCIGGTVSGSVADYYDPDNGPFNAQYSIASFNGPGIVDINQATGEWSWSTLEENDYSGEFELFIKASDGGNLCEGCNYENADTCSVRIKVIPIRKIFIEKTHGTLQGQTETVSIYQDSTIRGGLEMGGFDFLIQYDPTLLQFIDALPGSLLEECGWEYFTYRYGPNGNCAGSGCPNGILRIVAIAETNNGSSHPLCFDGTAGELAKIEYLVTNDRTAECMYVPINWIWYDCGDNTISSVTGDTSFISRHIYNFEDINGENSLHNLFASFPSNYGAIAECDLQPDPNKPIPSRCGVDFWNGGVDIICADSIDARGDLNLNEVANEISDAVLFSNYFIYGIGVFTINPPGQIAASDVNADGLTLSVADLVFLVRIIIGDAMPYHKEANPALIRIDIEKSGLVTSPDDISIGAAHIVIKGKADPILEADNMEMIYNYNGSNTNILIYSLAGNSFKGDIITTNGEILSIDLSDENGVPLVGKLIPTEYHLMQNYPNPFNPMTTISFELPIKSEFTLTIFNVNGQTVATFDDIHEAGRVDIIWDAADMASGVYFYRLDVNGNSETKKMVLLK